jgi:cobalt transporter subunit CbtB
MEATHILDHSDARELAVSGRWPAMAALVFGIVILYLVGFSTLPEAHNATHVTRHASGFPCH